MKLIKDKDQKRAGETHMEREMRIKKADYNATIAQMAAEKKRLQQQSFDARYAAYKETVAKMKAERARYNAEKAMCYAAHTLRSLAVRKHLDERGPSQFNVLWVNQLEVLKKQYMAVVEVLPPTVAQEIIVTVIGQSVPMAMPELNRVLHHRAIQVETILRNAA